MTLIVVYAAKGLTIPAGRLVRLTGNRNGPGWEIDLPTRRDQRTHALTLPTPSGAITAADWGQARALGELADLELAGAVNVDDDLCAEVDGRAYRAPGGSRNPHAVALAKMPAGKLCPVLLGLNRRR